MASGTLLILSRTIPQTRHYIYIYINQDKKPRYLMDEIGLRTSRPPPPNNVYKLCITFFRSQPDLYQKKNPG